MASMSIKATIIPLLFTGVLLCHINTGHADDPCQTTDITISTADTGNVVDGQPEHEVTVTNECSCPQGDIVFNCPADGLASAKGVDSTKIRVADAKQGLCLVNSGLQIFKDSPFTFTYASSSALDFSLYDAEPRC